MSRRQEARRADHENGPHIVTASSLSTKTRTLLAALAASGLLALSTARAAAEAALLVDAESGRVLYADNATHPWYPASVTKIMTAYVILKAVKEGRIALDKPLIVSENAVAQSPTKMGFAKGTLVTVDNALKMLMVKSANDMAVLLAEGLSGSIEGFSMEMNQAAERLGMTQTSYVNPNGLPAEGQVTSARDLAILARAVIHELPEYDLYFHIPAIKFGKRVIRNYNSLIDRYPGADGMKTGFICSSGFNLVATATRGGRRLIAVVLGSRSGLQRAEKAAQLLERGFTGGGGLSWLIPAGTVNSLQPVNAAPPDLRDDICGKGRRAKPPADSEEEPVATAEPGSLLAGMTSFQLGPRTHGSLLGPLTPSMAPIPVYAGLARQQPAGIELASGAPHVTKKKRSPPAVQAAAPAAPAAAATGRREAHARRATEKRAEKSSAKPASATEAGSLGKAKPKPKPVAAKQ
jgi:D-alanyl-D-alanine carboxypeptidase